MIGLKIQNKSGNESVAPRTYIKCPQCKKEDWFYTMIPEVCDECGFHWGRVRQLEKDSVRKYYHRKGEIG